MTRSSAQVLAEYEGTSATARDTYTYGASGRSSGAQAGVYIYDGRGSVSETWKGGKVTNTLRYDPSGHAGLFSKIVSAVKNTATKVVKTVTKTLSTVAKGSSNRCTESRHCGKDSSEPVRRMEQQYTV